METPYTFSSVITPQDEQLFQQANHPFFYEKLGAHPIKIDGHSGVVFTVFAPLAREVSVVGDFNKWNPSENPMYRHSSGIWELFIPELASGTLYKFSVNGRLKSDPYALASELRPNTASIVYESGYKWQSSFNAKSSINDPVSIYEVHLGSWRKDALSWRKLAETLVPYAKTMGFTHLELCPVMEHPLDESWGYQCTGLFAPTSRFGTPDDFKYFIDMAHKAGLGVILDWVPSHFPRDSHGLRLFDGTPLYEYADPLKAEHASWGTMVYDYTKPQIRQFLINSALFWLKEFRVDGLRCDAVASMLYLDYARKNWRPNKNGEVYNLEAIEFLKQLNCEIYKHFPYAATFAEESTIFPKVSHPVDKGGLGFGYKWNMGWMHDVLGYFQTDPIFRRHKHYDLVKTVSYAFTENFVLPFSHDEVVHCKSSLWGKMFGGEEQKFANLKALLALQFTFPGKKLLFMGSEFAQKSEWNDRGELDWTLLDNQNHKGVQNLVRSLNKLYRSEPALYNDAPDGFEWLARDDAEHSVFAYKRGNIAVFLNLTPVPRTFEQGALKLLLATEPYKNGVLPPLSAVIFRTT